MRSPIKPSSIAGRPVTLSAIARAAGVSVTAVSALYKGAFYGSGTATERTTVGISEEKRMHILATSRRLGFQPADPAWRLRLYPETGDVCFLLPDNVREGLANPYYSRFANGALGRLHEKGRHLGFAFYNYKSYGNTSQPLPGPIRSYQASAVLVAGTENPSLIQSITERGLPVIYLSRLAEIPGVVSFSPNYRQAAGLALRHLVGLGHRRIICAASSFMKGLGYASKELVAGWSEAWQALGLPGAAPEPIYGLTNPNPAEPGQPIELWRELRALNPRPTAIFFFDDYAALMVMRAALADGVSIPKDLSIVGTNNQVGAAEAEVPLTTIDFPAEKIGAEAVDLIDSHMGDVVRPSMANRVFPVTLIERASASAPA